MRDGPDTEHPGASLPDAPLERRHLVRRRDHPPGSIDSPGLFRYKRGIILLASLFLIALSLSTILTNLLHCCGENTPSTSLPTICTALHIDDGRSSMIVVRSPDGAYETFPAGAPIGDALSRWGVDTSDISEDTLAAPLPTGCRVVITGGPETTISLEPFDATDRFVLGIPFDINTASIEELSLIPGIGEALAERIVAHREEHGPFRDVTDLTAVPGIGAKKSETIMEYGIFNDMLDGPEVTR